MTINLLALLAAIVILVRCVCVISKLNHKNWHGHRAEFAGLALSYAMMAGGIVGIAVGWPPGATLLGCAVAGTVIFDRRNRT